MPFLRWCTVVGFYLLLCCLPSSRLLLRFAFCIAWSVFFPFARKRTGDCIIFHHTNPTKNVMFKRAKKIIIHLVMVYLLHSESSQSHFENRSIKKWSCRSVGECSTARQWVVCIIKWLSCAAASDAMPLTKCMSYFEIWCFEADGNKRGMGEVDDGLDGLDWRIEVRRNGGGQGQHDRSSQIVEGNPANPDRMSTVGQDYIQETFLLWRRCVGRRCFVLSYSWMNEREIAPPTLPSSFIAVEFHSAEARCAETTILSYQIHSIPSRYTMSQPNPNQPNFVTS